MGDIMKTGAIIKYLPNNTTEEEIKKIRNEFTSDEHKLILIVAGKENFLESQTIEPEP